MDWSWLAAWLPQTWIETAWAGLGLLAQAMFSMRFIIQWIASERARKSIMPETFWYFSFAGGVMLLAYAIHRQEAIFALGQAVGLIVYARNIALIWRSRRSATGA